MSRFGPFEPAFGSGELTVPGYLCLLNLMAPSETLVVIDRIRVGLDDPRRDAALHALLGQVDWRPHLVAAVALLLVEDSRPFLADLWSAVRAGSWVSPQPAARETEGFVVRPPIGLTSAERHSATGPASVPQRSAKELSAFVALCDATSQGAAWAAHVRAEPELQRLIAADVDRGGDIATRWLARVRQILHPPSDPK
jgi:hypothetical protein